MGVFIKVCALCSLSAAALFKLVDYVKFLRLYKAGQNIAVSDNELVRQLKRRFSDCFSLGKPINNTSAYISKMLKLSPYYGTKRVFSKLSIFFMGIFFALLLFGYRNNVFGADSVLVYGMLSFFFYYTEDRLFYSKALQEGFICACADYLDNTLRNRQNAKYLQDTLRSVDTFDRKSSYENAPVVKQERSGEKKVSVPAAAAADPELIASIIDEFIL